MFPLEILLFPPVSPSLPLAPHLSLSRPLHHLSTAAAMPSRLPARRLRDRPRLYIASAPVSSDSSDVCLWKLSRLHPGDSVDPDWLERSGLPRRVPRELVNLTPAARTSSIRRRPYDRAKGRSHTPLLLLLPLDSILTHPWHI